MLPLLLLGVCAFVLALILTPLCGRLLRRFNVFDVPNEPRKLHAEPIPRAGGIALALSLAGTYGVVYLLEGRFRPEGGPGVVLVWRMLPGAAIVFLTGLLDDLISLRAWQKLIGQLMAAGWACYAGLRITNLAGQEAD